MGNIGDKEKVTQKNVIKLFTEVLGYEYLGNLQHLENRNVNEKLLRLYLNKKGYEKELIDIAINELVNKCNQTEGLYGVNKEIYSLLRYGTSKTANVKDKPKTVKFIDFEDFSQNDFYIAEEVTIKEKNKKRPDLVIYVNGIALGVIELKRSSVSVSEGIRQNLTNQEEKFIKSFFNSIQIVMAGNDSQGLRYGTIETKEKYYLEWKEDEKAEDKVSKDIRKLCAGTNNLLHKHIISMCSKERFLEIIHDFIVFDRGTKKICRHNQYFGVKAAQENVKKHEGGIIWHTQGSGKSLTMVLLTKWIMEHKNDSRILVVTDREELDEQIEKVYMGVGENIYRTSSGADLIEKLNSTTPLLMCSLIHKFGKAKNDDEAYEKGYDDYINELKAKLPSDFKAKGDIYVFVDECHRTQSGKLHAAMKSILPDALFIGFTGTPLLKDDKKKSVEIFGPYIHTYKFNEAVKDKVVLDLRYEARDIKQKVVSKDKIDNWFNIKTKGLTDVAKAQLKKRWGNLQTLYSSKERLERIAGDIMYDMETKDRLQNGRGNAILVAGSIYEACKFYEIFINNNFKKCAIITSYEDSPNKIKTEVTGENGVTEELKKSEVYKKMLNGRSVSEFEKDVKDKFIKEPAQMKLLIVVDKLLTGFDAPPATYLYIDKNMKDHGLFQAVCRVNRLDGVDKEFGYIIDYKDLFDNLSNAMTDYTSGAFHNYDTEDINGLLKNRIQCGRERLNEIIEALEALCEPVEYPRGHEQYKKYFIGDNTKNIDAIRKNEKKRLELYKLVSSLIRAYSDIANDIDKKELKYTKEEISEIRKKVRFYTQLRDEIKIISGDKIDLKRYEPMMRQLIDMYVSAEDSQVLAAFDDKSLLDIIMAKGNDFLDSLPKNIKNNEDDVAEAVENNIRRLIVDRSETNPKYYSEMSELLDRVIQQRIEEVQTYKEYLEEIVEITRQTMNPDEGSRYPEKVNKTPGLRALYDNIGDEDIAIKLHEDIANYSPDSWRGNSRKEKQVVKLIKKYITDEEKMKNIYDIIFNQDEYK